MGALIAAHGLAKSFGAARAVDGLSLQIAAGEIYGLVGPDGAGKTTTMRLLCGALRADQGQATIAGFDIGRETEAARARLGYLPQRFSLYEELTVLENIRFFAEVRGLSAAEWRPVCLEILAFVGLDRFTGRRAGHLSGGMKQKLGLAAALVHRPQVLLLDEPTTGVDPVTRQDFWQLIIRLAGQREVAVLVSTPYMDEAARCTRVGFLRAGRLLVEGAPGALRQALDGRILELQGQPLLLPPPGPGGRGRRGRADVRRPAALAGQPGVCAGGGPTAGAGHPGRRRPGSSLAAGADAARGSLHCLAGAGRMKARKESAGMRSFFGSFTLAGVQVELVGGLQHREPGENWLVAPDLLAHRRWVAWAEMQVPVFALEFEAQAYAWMGRAAKAAAIRAVLRAWQGSERG
jgi:ABC-2 type transport system ATP-binding protein